MKNRAKKQNTNRGDKHGTKTHVYHRGLCFVSSKATMAKEKECLRTERKQLER